MKIGDLVRINPKIKTHHSPIGLILEIFPNGIVRNQAQQTLTKILWNDGDQTVEFLEDLKVHYEVIQ